MEIKLKNAPGATKERKRLGRGQASGLGTTAGKGNKGQKARKGYSRKVDFEGGQMPLFRRIPKRGFSNFPFKKEYQEVNVDLLSCFENGSTVTNLDLYEEGLIKNIDKPFKILGKLPLNKSINIQLRTIMNGKKKVQFDKCTKGAKETIEKAGGKVLIQ
jgi:large subunit ribosomal protein L15